MSSSTTTAAAAAAASSSGGVRVHLNDVNSSGCDDGLGEHHHQQQQQQHRYHRRYYALVGLASIAACAFHTSIYRRYDRMQNGLKQASDIKFGMEMEELHALELVLESSDLQRHSINHTILAFHLAHEAAVMKHNIVNETKDLTKLEQEANEDEEDAARNKKEADLWAVRNYGDNLAAMGSKTTGQELAKMADYEHEMATEHLQNYQRNHKDGVNRLRQAQDMVRTAKEHDEVAANAQASYGICRLFPYACNLVSSRTDEETAQAASSSISGTSTATATTATAASVQRQPSAESIRANQAVQNAIREINDSLEERDLAYELFHNSSVHLNASSQLLHESQLFTGQAEYDKEESLAYRDAADEESSEAVKDENLIEKEKHDIEVETMMLDKYVNESRSILHVAIAEHRRAFTAKMKLENEMVKIHSMEQLWNTTMVESYRHISKAGWYALVATVASIGLLLLVLVRIVATFRYSRPLTWIVRYDSASLSASSNHHHDHHRIHDILYLVNHISIMVLTMGVVGELLFHFQEETTVAKVAITMLFAFVAAIFQVVLLHLMPHVFRLARQPDLVGGGGIVRVLVYEDIAKKGTIVFLLCAMEVLLIWIVAGNIIFQRAYKWDTWAVWFGVFALAVSYSIFLRNHECVNPHQSHSNRNIGIDTSGYLDVFDGVNSDSTPYGQDEVERQALLSSFKAECDMASSSSGIIANLKQSSSSSGGVSRQSGATTGSVAIDQSHNSSRSSRPSMKSIPLGSSDESSVNGTTSCDVYTSAAVAHVAGVGTGTAGGYGSVANKTENEDRLYYDHLFNDYPQIHSTFVSSWKIELEKLRLVFELLLACWAIWIMRSSIMLIVKLAPLTRSDIAWGRCPLWVLNIFLMMALICFGIRFNHSQCRKG